MTPFREGTPAQFAAIRDLLTRCDYTDTAIASRVGVRDIYQFRTIEEGRENAVEINDPLDLLIRLFLDGMAVSSSAVADLIAGEGLDALIDLRLLDRHSLDPDRFAASVRLYPTESLYLVSDLDENVPGLATQEEALRPDHVFSAITTLTGTFLRQLPRTPCGNFLELCAGTGVAALAASRHADEVWAADITERSTQFARFNGLLNGVANFNAVQGDLYEPVRGMTFDRIVAHPPYVPSDEIKVIYRDGGDDGEAIIRRILAELPDYLAPGGCFYCTCIASDRRDAPLEQRIRGLIGERESEFDILLISHEALHPTEYYCRLAASGRITFAHAEQRHNMFKQLGAERIVYCSMVVERHKDFRPAITNRRERATTASGNETEALRRWLHRARDEAIDGSLLDERLKVSPHASLHVTHQSAPGEWRRSGSRIEVKHPFLRTVDISANGAILLTLFTGEPTARQILQQLRSAGGIPAELSDIAFIEFLNDLVSEGVLVIES